MLSTLQLLLLIIISRSLNFFLSFCASSVFCCFRSPVYVFCLQSQSVYGCAVPRSRDCWHGNATNRRSRCEGYSGFRHIVVGRRDLPTYITIPYLELAVRRPGFSYIYSPIVYSRFRFVLQNIRCCYCFFYCCCCIIYCVWSLLIPDRALLLIH